MFLPYREGYKKRKIFADCSGKEKIKLNSAFPCVKTWTGSRLWEIFRICPMTDRTFKMCVSCQNLCVLSKFTFFGYNWLSHSQFCFLWFVVKSGHFRFPFAGRAFLRGPLLIGLISWNKGTDKWVSYWKQPELNNSQLCFKFQDYLFFCWF